MMKLSLMTSVAFATLMMLSSCGESYKEVTIGNQIWMSENLNVDKFRNGEPILHAKTDEEWENAGKNKQAAWCYYNNDPANEKKYGKLYNWYAVNDARGLAPEGWKVPTDQDWTALTDFLGGENIAEMKMKFTDFWTDNEGNSKNGTNESGFSALPGGDRDYNGDYSDIGKDGVWWSSSMYNTSNPVPSDLVYSFDFVYRNGSNKEEGLSVRCIRD
jgi:uncharacterized protein (TIGR02145 family)